jgi:hypothetical protein
MSVQGCALATLGEGSFPEGATLNELRWCLLPRNRATLSGLRTISSSTLEAQGFKANPGLELANALSVLRHLIKL